MPAAARRAGRCHPLGIAGVRGSDHVEPSWPPRTVETSRRSRPSRVRPQRGDRQERRQHECRFAPRSRRRDGPYVAPSERWPWYTDLSQGSLLRSQSHHGIGASRCLVTTRMAASATSEKIATAADHRDVRGHDVVDQRGHDTAATSAMHTPPAAPRRTGIMPRRRNRPMIWRDSAPNARRNPTSRRRCATTNAVNPYRPTAGGSRGSSEEQQDTGVEPWRAVACRARSPSARRSPGRSRGELHAQPNAGRGPFPEGDRRPDEEIP